MHTFPSWPIWSNNEIVVGISNLNFGLFLPGSRVGLIGTVMEIGLLLLKKGVSESNTWDKVRQE